MNFNIKPALIALSLMTSTCSLAFAGTTAESDALTPEKKLAAMKMIGTSMGYMSSAGQKCDSKEKKLGKRIKDFDEKYFALLKSRGAAEGLTQKHFDEYQAGFKIGSSAVGSQSSIPKAECDEFYKTFPVMEKKLNEQISLSK